MEQCPRCGVGVDELHPLPPEIITKEVIVGISNDDRLPELAACRDCIVELMES